jgi:hypothetical protein
VEHGCNALRPSSQVAVPPVRHRSTLSSSLMSVKDAKAWSALSVDLAIKSSSAVAAWTEARRLSWCCDCRAYGAEFV